MASGTACAAAALAIRLFEYFRGRMHTAFGIGTNLTNDLGYEALQIVIKMTRCNGQPVAKISDEPSKSMDYDPSYVAYLREVFQVPRAEPQGVGDPMGGVELPGPGVQQVRRRRERGAAARLAGRIPGLRWTPCSHFLRPRPMQNAPSIT